MDKRKNVNNVNNDVSPIMMISIFVIFIVAMVFVTYFGMNLQSPASKYFSPYNTKINNDLLALLKQQKSFDDKIKELSQDKQYTFESPMIVKSPYHINKLSALIIFTTEEESKVQVKINDEEVTTVEKSTNHIIPIYGLYADFRNTVTLTLDDGRSVTKEIIIEPYNFELNSLNIKDVIGNEDIYYLAGDINSSDSTLRGFDKNNNLNSYVSFGYIGGFSVFKNKLAIAYNQNKDVINDLRLDIDYLGRISNITPNTNEIKYESNISGDGVSYVGDSGFLYNELTANYSFNELTNNEPYTTKKTLILSDYEMSLSGAVKLEQPFKVSYMNDYISYSSDVTGELLVITRDGGLYSYDIDKDGIIRTDIKGDKSLYIKVDGVIYSLKTTLDDNADLK